jgi:hypothetical protein
MHFKAPVFVVSDREETFYTGETSAVYVGIDVGNVADVVAVLFEPEAKWIFPK